MVNAKGEAVYVKFHFKTDQGIKNLCAQEAGRLAGADPDHAIRDLYNAIARGEYPSWTFYIQVMTFQQVIYLLFIYIFFLTGCTFKGRKMPF